MAEYFYSPLSVMLLISLVLLAILLLPLLFLGIIGSALSKLGFGLWQAVFLVFAMIIGSFINIPAGKIKNEAAAVRVPHGNLLNKNYSAPDFLSETKVYVNAGGCLIPLLVSAYLLVRVYSAPEFQGVFLPAMTGIAVVSLVTHWMAKPVSGVGIKAPFFIPPLCALLCGIILSGGITVAAPVIAYVSATAGTLIGADLLNLKKAGKYGILSVSIGGAGTFDGIFLAGIIAAFLA